ncbi:hypothetical protein QJQ45_029950, partial [Haematococcus lacustris]
MAGARIGKRQKIVYRDDPHEKVVVELEEFLFGARGGAASVFSARAEQDEEGEDATLSDLLHKAAPRGRVAQTPPPPPLFFEDKGPRRPPPPAKRRASRASKRPVDSSSSSGDGGRGGGSSGEEGGSSEQGMGMASSGDEGSTRGGSSSSSSSGASEGSGGPEDSSSSEEGSDKEGGGTATATGGAQGVREGEGGGRGGVGQGRVRRAVWADPADAALSVSLASSARTRKLRNSHKQDKVSGLAYEAALRKQHAALHTRTAWAQVKPRSSLAGRQAGLGGDPAGEEEEEEEEEEDRGVAGLLTSAHSLLDRGPGRMPPGLLETSRVKDANQGEPCQGVVRSVSFHPAAAGLMLTASLDRKLRLFQVDGVRNSAVQTVFLADCPIQQASWAAGGAQVVMAGRRPHFYCYDLGGGRVERVLGPA